MVNKGTVKAAEVEASGINEWLDLQSGKVTREQVAAYLAANGVRVEEVELGGPRDEDTHDAAIAALEAEDNLGYDTPARR